MWVFEVNLFKILKSLFFCFVVNICGLVHDMETIHGLC